MTDAVRALGLIRIHASEGGPVAALRGLDLRVATGEIAAVVGPSGSGKSTLLRVLAGLDRPSAGRLTVFGQDLVTASDRELAGYRRDQVGLVEQHYRRALSPYLRAADAIALPLALRGVRPGDRKRRVEDLLDRVGLAERRRAFRHELSGGEQQRVAFAVALAARPSLLLADEPTGELDGTTAESLLQMARDLVRADGATCIIVTHDRLVERFADRVVHVADGRVVAERSDGMALQRAVDGQGWLAP
ncbi:MAG TPA: ABC transporter ATP-binding protein, partial [Methylomirabilota bacterium]|nr:ABC transporter ATP-binding protein [Methylomirabilota bacterium]